MGKIDIYGGITQYGRCINDFNCIKVDEYIEIVIGEYVNNINGNNYSVDIIIYDSDNPRTKRIINRAKISIVWVNKNNIVNPTSTYTVKPLILNYICANNSLTIEQEKDIAIKDVNCDISIIPQDAIYNEIIEYLNSFSELRDNTSFQRAIEIINISLIAMIGRITTYWQYSNVTGKSIVNRLMRKASELDYEKAKALLKVVNEIKNL